MQLKLVDNYARRFEYLRLSLTELCNFRCQYCLPDGYQANHHAFLTLSEIDLIVSAFANLGVKKIRLTGGEPTLRRDFCDILATIKKHKQIKELAITTNGSRLYQQIEQWHELGLTSLNVSIDSFSREHFQLITGEDKLFHVLKGLDKAIEIGVPKIKINTVLMKNMNNKISDYLPWLKSRPIELRFIELMETNDSHLYFKKHHVSGHEIEQELINQGWKTIPKAALSGPAKVYQHDDYLGKIGLIMPYEKNFCDNCNRLRVSATGKLHYCLFGESAIDLRDLLQKPDQQDELKSRILSSLKIKPPQHYLHSGNTGITQNLSTIGG